MGVGMIGWWGCVSCGHKVPNDHRGPCPVCGNRIRRIVRAEIDVKPATGAAAYDGQMRTSLGPVFRPMK